MRWIAAFALLSCGGAFVRCPPLYHFPDQTHYDVRPAWTTSGNVAVDPSGLPINAQRVDRLVAEVDACLAASFPAGELPEGASCEGSHFTPLCHACLTVKIAPDWFLSSETFAGSKHQLLPQIAGYGDCGKGLTLGPCYRRAALQDGWTVVVPPSMHLIKDPLVKLATGCHDPWQSPALSACMTPTTGALDDGSGP